MDRAAAADRVGLIAQDHILGRNGIATVVICHRRLPVHLTAFCLKARVDGPDTGIRRFWT